jgi:hypothetical protein
MITKKKKNLMYTLHHKPKRGGTSRQIALTEQEAAHLLDKKLIQYTGSQPGEVFYYSSVSILKLNQEIKKVTQ